MARAAADQPRTTDPRLKCAITADGRASYVLAALVPIKPQTLAEITAGSRQPTAQQQQRLAEILDIERSRLFGSKPLVIAPGKDVRSSA